MTSFGDGIRQTNAAVSLLSLESFNVFDEERYLKREYGATFSLPRLYS